MNDTGRAAAPFADVSVVVIGRNEGERLRRSLLSVLGRASLVVYVDSGSDDGSVALAHSLGAHVVELDMSLPFTAARARNAGFRELLQLQSETLYVQFVDGDCELREGWLGAARAALEANPSLALVFGRRRERDPEFSIYNALCDDEWNVPVGEAAGCGGDAMFRAPALQSVSGYVDTMIAGEDSELSMRLRKAGWRLERIDAEMTWHDANMSTFSQFWTRARRSGYAFAEMAHRHPDARWPNWPRICLSILFWGAGTSALCLATAALAIAHSPLWWIAALGALIAWPLKIAQIFFRQRARGLSARVSFSSATLLMVGKVAQFMGLSQFHIDRWRNRSSTIIEYKGSRAS